MKAELIRLFAPFLALVLIGPRLPAADWPMWRCDANRSAATPQALPEKLSPRWTLTLPPLEKAWQEQGKEQRLSFDEAYTPVVAGHTMFVCSSFSDSLHAYDTRNGAERWRFFADGPMRLAPAVANGRVYAVSDDGCLYCLDAERGGLLWKYRGAPNNRQALGNSRMISLWPARGGPVVSGNRVFFTAGIWPFMGVFVYALDAATGEAVWVNDGSGSIYCLQPHAAMAFAGLAPQGHLALVNNTLLLPNSRSGAAALSAVDGALAYFNHGGRGRGSAYVAGFGDGFNNAGDWRSLTNGPPLGELMNGAVLTLNAFYTGSIEALDPFTLSSKWVFPAPGFTVYCKAGKMLYAGNGGRILAIEDQGRGARGHWSAKLDGAIKGMLAADDRLFVVTKEGRIHCFGADDAGPTVPAAAGDAPSWPAADHWTVRAKEILDASNQREGYCLVSQAGNGRLMEELQRQSALNVIGLSSNSTEVLELRKRWARLGVPAARLSVRDGGVETAGLPPYFANLIAMDDSAISGTNAAAAIAAAFSSLRPYGGEMMIHGEHQALVKRLAASGLLANAGVATAGAFTRVTRAGALPGAADWTHQYADAANTAFSRDRLVQAPLGVLWFGGSSNDHVLPRHGHGPTEQVIDGRLIIEGPDHLRAMDIYTGRVLWETELPGLGAAYDNTSHQPGANHIGSNYASAPDGIYVCRGGACLRLDPATGRTLASFTMPDRAVFAQVKIWRDLLIVAADPLSFSDAPVGDTNWNASCSRTLAALDRYTGKAVWSLTAANAFHHNTIVAGSNMVFCIDRLPPRESAGWSLRGFRPVQPALPFRLLALEARTGREVWTATNDVFGTWLGYSREYNVLLQSGRKTRDTVRGEPSGRLVAFRADSGAMLWDTTNRVADGVYALCNDTILTQTPGGGAGLDLLTGEPRLRGDALTGELAPWSFTRQYGCNSAVASERLLTFRSGAAGYYDLLRFGGTGNLGGFKSGCSSSLIAAGGVLSAPDYTRTCVCDYQLQTSLGLIHMPEAEMWTYGAAQKPAAAIRRVGINFGAPGNRMSESGVLWLEHPASGAPSPTGLVAVAGSPRFFRHHAARHAGEPMAWVTASGAIGATGFTLEIGNRTPARYTVRLFFAEPEGKKPGERVFDAAIQGQKVLANFDIAREGGSDGGGVVRSFAGISIGRQLRVGFTALAGQPVICGVEATRE